MTLNIFRGTREVPPFSTPAHATCRTRAAARLDCCTLRSGGAGMFAAASSVHVKPKSNRKGQYAPTPSSQRAGWGALESAVFPKQPIPRSQLSVSVFSALILTYHPRGGPQGCGRVMIGIHYIREKAADCVPPAEASAHGLGRQTLVTAPSSSPRGNVEYDPPPRCSG